jgi:signal transduction histidine kinase
MFGQQQAFRQLPCAPTMPIRLKQLRWIIPAGLLLIVAGYELGPSMWLAEHIGPALHLLVEILIYGTVGPTLAFVLLTILGRWQDERETSDLQSRLLSAARAQVRAHRQMSDRALQELFAASMHLSALEAGLEPDTAEELRAIRRALDASIQQLRAELLSAPDVD